MTVLALDTCLAACSAAVLQPEGGKTPCARIAPMERGHAEALFPMIEAVMKEARVAFSDLTRIAVTTGPGTFTGVRVGIAAARGLALACGAPVVGTTSLHVMAKAALAALSGQPQGGKGVVIAHDARRGEVYVQCFGLDGMPLSEALIATPQEAARLCEGFALVAGSGAALVAPEAGRMGLAISAAMPYLLPDAAHLALLTCDMPAPDRPISPLYLRAPDAKPQEDKSLARV